MCGSALDIDGNYGHLLTGSWRKSSTLQVQISFKYLVFFIYIFIEILKKIWDLRKYDLIRDVFKKRPSMMVINSNDSFKII